MTVKLSIPASLLMPGSVGRQTIGSLGSSEDSTTGSLKKPTFSERHPKAVRSVTVIGYLFCVSLAAIVLSAYYVVLWKPKISEPPTNNANANNTCHHRGHVSPEPGTVVYYQRSSSGHRSSKYTYNPFRVIAKPPLGAPKPEVPIVVPQPSKLVSHLDNLESFQHVDSNNNNSSLQGNNSSYGLAPVHNNSNTSSISTKPTVNATFVEKHHLQATSESEDDFAESTLVPSVPSIRNSIIFKKLHDINVESNNNRSANGKVAASSSLVEAEAKSQ